MSGVALPTEGTQCQGLPQCTSEFGLIQDRVSGIRHSVPLGPGQSGACVIGQRVDDFGDGRAPGERRDDDLTEELRADLRKC